MTGENKFFINLGDKWGHVIELTELLSMKHIHNDAEGFIAFMCMGGEGEEPTEYRSAHPFTETEISVEKKKLIRYASGYVTKEDVNDIISLMNAKAGKDTIEHNAKEDWIEIEALRKMYYDLNEIPYYRMVLDFDGVNGGVNIKADSNPSFDKMALKWLEENGIEGVETSEDARLLFGAEIIQNQVDTLFPDEDDGPGDMSIEVPAETVTVRGNPKQQIDIAKISKDNRFTISQ